MPLRGIEEVSTTSDSTAFWGFDLSNLHFFVYSRRFESCKSRGDFLNHGFFVFCANLVKYFNESF